MGVVALFIKRGESLFREKQNVQFCLISLKNIRELTDLFIGKSAENSYNAPTSHGTRSYWTHHHSQPDYPHETQKYKKKS
jgi:hypothetical protein